MFLNFKSLNNVLADKLGVPTTFPAKFRIWPPNVFGGLNQKSAPYKAEMRFGFDS